MQKHTQYRSVGDFLEKADRRTNEFKIVNDELEKLEAKFGKNSTEVNNFFLKPYKATTQNQKQ